jgi:hypothetical protein
MDSAEIHAHCVAMFYEASLSGNAEEFPFPKKLLWVTVFLVLSSAVWSSVQGSMLKHRANQTNDKWSHIGSLALGALAYVFGAMLILIVILIFEMAFPSANERSDSYFLTLSAAIIAICTEAVIAVGKFLEELSEKTVELFIKD